MFIFLLCISFFICIYYLSTILTGCRLCKNLHICANLKTNLILFPEVNANDRTAIVDYTVLERNYSLFLNWYYKLKAAMHRENNIPLSWCEHGQQQYLIKGRILQCHNKITIYNFFTENKWAKSQKSQNFGCEWG